jgi:hypothetical protein
MKVGAYGAASAKEHAARRKVKEKNKNKKLTRTFLTIGNVVGFILNFNGRSMAAI